MSDKKERKKKKRKTSSHLLNIYFSASDVTDITCGRCPRREAKTSDFI